MAAVDLRLVGVCGLYCGECEILIAYATDDAAKRAEIAESIGRQYGTEINPQEIVCEGCRGPIEKHFCVACKIRPCAQSRGFLTCAECDDVGSCRVLAVLLGSEMGGRARKNLERIRKIGLEAWLEEKEGSD